MFAGKSFRVKLLLSYILVILLSFGFIAFFLDRNLAENSLKNIQSSLVKEAALIKNQITPDDLKKDNPVYLGTLIVSLGKTAECRITILNAQGEVLADSAKTGAEISGIENHLDRPEVKSALQGGIGIDSHYSKVLKTNMLYVALPLRDKSEIAGVIRLAIPLTSVQKMLRTTRKTVFAGLCFAIGIALLVGALSANRILKPINKMMYASARFTQGDFSCRIYHHSRDEIGQLAATLNKMAQEIEAKIREIQKQNQHLAAIFNSMIEGVIVVDKTGCIVSVNHTIEKIFGITGKEAKGRLFLEAIRNNDIFEIITAVLKKGEPISKDLVLLWPVQKVFQVNASPVFENDTISGSLVVIHDMSEIRRLETMRRDFVANVSHELKTPLTSIKGFVETLLEGALEDRANSRHFLGIIKDHADRLDKLINDLLDLSHIESKEIRLEKKKFKMRELVEEVLFGFKTQLRKKNIACSNEVASELFVEADKDTIEQVLTNLIDNAAKFNKEAGTIKIYSQDLPHAVKISIEDSGQGIPAKDIPRIFERFYRVDKARSRELGGTGLGLSIVKHIVELHGGSVGVESTEGLGSQFWFTLLR